MKPFPRLVFLRLLCIGFFITTLTACKTIDGLKADFDSIDFGKFSMPSFQGSSRSEFLIDGDCPSISIVDELSTISQFSPVTKTQDENLTSTITMSKAKSDCEYNDGSVTVDLKLTMDGEKGPKASTNSFEYPFFIAVTSASDKILAKEIFAAPVTYRAGNTRQTYIETLRQIIPAGSRAEGSSYKVVIGFQLTKAQLAYNRAKIQEALELARLEEEAQKATEKAQMQAEKDGKPFMATQTTNTSGNRVIKVPAPEEEQMRAGPLDIFKTSR